MTKTIADGRYILHDTIGEGSFGEVYFASDLETGADVAVKCIYNEDLEGSGLEDFIRKEKEILRRIHSTVPGGHKNICKLFDIIETETMSYIVMEYVKGGNLEQTLQNRRLFSPHSHRKAGTIHEKLARHIFRQMVAGTEFLHRRHQVVHRDLQLANILLDVAVPVTCHKVMRNADIVVKLADFGLATPFTRQLQTLGGEDCSFCGTPQYCAPELFLNKQYEGPEVDIWALGVCLYRMVVGHMPFRFSKDTVSRRFTIPLEKAEISEECRDLLDSMLQTDSEKRATLHQVKNHVWCKNKLLRPHYLNSPTLRPDSDAPQ
eukprot:gb/GECH01005137.1/.p1 GENE.gb/GECH01005137.1/~~gb/GECH01005137.1/.p1  ORF type:complete len:319 (+),score=67.99 gb/GECH01005137.1/:1-957(+)